LSPLFHRLLPGLRWTVCLLLCATAVTSPADPGQAPAEGPVLRSRLSASSYTLLPGQCQSFLVAVEGSGPVRPQVRWSLTGGGALDRCEGEAVEYRAPRAGGCTAVLAASLAGAAAPTVSFAISVPADPEPAPELPPAVDLLPLLALDPAERDQGACNNCYAWAVTAALEMELNVRYGIRDRLSIQYFHSIYRPLSRTDPADPCGANPASLVTDLYRADGKLVPWSNPHAEYRAGGYPRVPAAGGETIGLLPHYRIEQLSLHQIATHLWSDAEIIAELKTRLHQRKAIIFKLGGHYAVIVGYDARDPQPANHAWVVLDSLGTSASRPGATYRLAMDRIDYNHQDGPGRFSYTFEYIDPLLLRLQPEGPPASTITAERTELEEGEPLKLVASVGGRPPVRYQWLKDGQPLAGQTGSILRLPAVTPADGGAYAVQASNGTGSAASESLRVVVRAAGQPANLTLDPPAATLGAGGSRRFTARLTGLGDGRVRWSLGGAGELDDPEANPVTFRAGRAAGTPVLTARAQVDPALAASAAITIKTLDFNGDGSADVLDLALLAGAYDAFRGDPHYLEAADLNGDGRVGPEDAEAFLALLELRP